MQFQHEINGNLIFTAESNKTASAKKWQSVCPSTIIYRRSSSFSIRYLKLTCSSSLGTDKSHKNIYTFSVTLLSSMARFICTSTKLFISSVSCNHSLCLHRNQNCLQYNPPLPAARARRQFWRASRNNYLRISLSDYYLKTYN